MEKALGYNGLKTIIIANNNGFFDLRQHLLGIAINKKCCSKHKKFLESLPGIEKYFNFFFAELKSILL